MSGRNLSKGTILIVCISAVASILTCPCHALRHEALGNNLVLGGGTADLISSGLLDAVTDGQVNSHNPFKTDLSVCLANYDVSDGSIIRTRDSTTLGAHYLNVSDVGIKGRDDCLELCCRFKQCNVAVFEEKNSGSCYLFDCGPPDAFKCKFTTQSQYMSAILRRKDYELQFDELFVSKKKDVATNQHENELSQLRNNREGMNPNGNGIVQTVQETLRNMEKQQGQQHQHDVSQQNPMMVNIASEQKMVGPAIPVMAPRLIGDTTTTPKSTAAGKEKTDGRCNEWQFQCKTSKECIPIYDVCSGVAQCSDGSDEAPQLHCPHEDGGYGSQASGNAGYSQSHQINGNNLAGSGLVKNVNTYQMNGMSIPIRQQENGAEKSTIFSRHQGKGIIPAIDSSYPQPQNVIGGDQKAQGNLQTGLGGGSFQSQQQLPILYNENRGQLEMDSAVKFPLDSLSHQSNPQGSSQGMMTLQQGRPLNANGNPNLQVSFNPYNPPYQGSQLPNTQIMNPPQLNQPIFSQNQVPYFKNLNPNNNYIDSSNGNVGQNNVANVRFPLSPNNAPFVPNNQYNIVPVQQNQSKVSETGKLPESPVIATTMKSIKKSQPELEKELVQKLIKQPYTSDFQNVRVDLDYPSPHVGGAGAIFAFIVGVAMSVIMVVIVACRFRTISPRRRSTNRLDSDYLVDGMYL